MIFFFVFTVFFFLSLSLSLCFFGGDRSFHLSTLSIIRLAFGEVFDNVHARTHTLSFFCHVLSFDPRRRARVSIKLSLSQSLFLSISISLPLSHSLSLFCSQGISTPCSRPTRGLPRPPRETANEAANARSGHSSSRSGVDAGRRRRSVGGDPRIGGRQKKVLRIVVLGQEEDEGDEGASRANLLARGEYSAIRTRAVTRPERSQAGPRAPPSSCRVVVSFAGPIGRDTRTTTTTTILFLARSSHASLSFPLLFATILLAVPATPSWPDEQRACDNNRGGEASNALDLSAVAATALGS